MNLNQAKKNVELKQKKLSVALVDSKNVFELLKSAMVRELAGLTYLVIEKLPQEFPDQIRNLDDKTLEQLKSKLRDLEKESADVVDLYFNRVSKLELEGEDVESDEWGPPSVRSAYWLCRDEIKRILKAHGINVEHWHVPVLNPHSEDQRDSFAGAFFKDGWTDEFAAAHQDHVLALRKIDASKSDLNAAENEVTRIDATARWKSV